MQNLEKRPAPSEFPDYYTSFVARVPEKSWLEALTNATRELEAFFPLLNANNGDYKYAEGKWSIKEVIQHLIDTERVLTYRALSFARSKAANLPGFDQDEWVTNFDAEARKVDDIINEFRALRQHSLLFYGSLKTEEFSKTGIGSGLEMSVLATAYIAVGHQRHHLEVIREKYLK